MRTHFVFCALAGVLLLSGCGEGATTDRPPEERPPSPEMFAGLPLLRGARITAGSGEAAEAVATTQAPADSMARYYRSVFIERRWTIRGDATAPDGSVTLHAASPEGRPIWVTIRPVSPTSSEVSVIASAPTVPAPDSAATRH